MIKLTVSHHKLTASGHALFAKNGQDIVCAAVSGIIFGALPWFETNSIAVQEDATVPSLSLELVQPTAKLITGLSVVIMQLKTLAHSYPQFISFEDQRKDE
nr:ribosomal-processing cysteine protease Prp [Mycoplasmoides pneumoniae]